MKLRIKIMSGFLILAVMLAVAGIFSIYELTSIGSSVRSLLDDNYKSIDAAKKMIEALEREDSGLLLLIAGRREEGQKLIGKADDVFMSALHTAKNNLTIPNEINIIEEIDRQYEKYKTEWSSAFEGVSADFDINWYFNYGHPAFLSVKTSVDELLTLNDKTMDSTASNLQNRIQRIIMPGIVAIVAALVFALVFNFFINHYFINPLISITKEVQKIVKTGNPSHIEIETNDEIKDLASAVNNLSYQIKKPK